MKTLIPILLLLPAFAVGSVLLTITTPTLQYTPPGGIPNPNCVNDTLSCLLFSGDIVPDPSADTYVNDIQIDFTPLSASLINDDNFFFANVPGLFFATDPTYSGPIFEIDIALDALPAIYNGTATLLGGTNGPGDLNPLASDNFTVVVTPEPAAVWMTALGLVVLAARRTAWSAP
jgi:hypothetical protein